jgi:two-component system, sensor histidine kinase
MESLLSIFIERAHKSLAELRRSMRRRGEPTPLRPERLDEVRGEQIAALFRVAPVGLAAALFGALLLVAVLRYVYALDETKAAIWLALALVDFLNRQLICLLYWRKPASRRPWRRWAFAFTLATVVGGLVWGVGGVWMSFGGGVEQEMVVVLFLSATASGAVLAFGNYLPATYGYFIPAMAPYMAFSATRGDPIHNATIWMDLTFLAAISGLAYLTNRSLVESLNLRFDNALLIEDLRREKAAAEEANLAKSRFLAAASHDLRQPVHALGMFVGALGVRDLDGESRRLVEAIENSVEAMDNLFVSLLDVSRLDAGVVEPARRNFKVAPALERVCRELAAEADGKSLRLTLVPSSAAVYSDPVLLERILRNLVANAVRYTDAGRVIVGCRLKGSPVPSHLSIEIWDTGRGIAETQREKIFEEFFQIDNPERDRSKGLGLGLAIVRRLSALLACPVELSSTPGKGTCVKVRAPLAPRSAIVGVEERSETPVVAPRPRRIYVIDDEAAVREGMRSLLESWGHDVVDAETGAEILARERAGEAAPDLVICDYRLRGDESGIEVINALRERCGRELPAMLITGDTAPDRLVEARRAGFVLLHKPVPAGKLRAALGNLMSKTLAGSG